MRTFSPMIARTDTSMSSPIMMLWLDFLVRTSMPASMHSLSGPPAPCPALPSYKNPFPAIVRAKQGRLVVLPPFHGPTVPQAPTQPDPHLGSPGPDRCLDRPSARGQ